MSPRPNIPTIGQISRPVATYMIAASYPSNELEQMLHRAMLGEMIEVHIAATMVYVFRNHEFDNWWLIEPEGRSHGVSSTATVRKHHEKTGPPHS